MLNEYQRGLRALVATLVWLAIGFSVSPATNLYAKQKHEVSPDDPTLRLYALLDSSYGGKLGDFCILADVYKDPNQPDEEFRHVLRVEYGKNRAFGRLTLYVRSVGKMTETQLTTYTPKQIYDFGETDLEKFVKTDPGPFGGAGDLYLRSGPDSPLASAPITEEAKKSYDTWVTQFLLPALQKK